MGLADSGTAGPRPSGTAEPGPSARLVLNGDWGVGVGSESQGRAPIPQTTSGDAALLPTEPHAGPGLFSERTFWKGLLRSTGCHEPGVMGAAGATGAAGPGVGLSVSSSPCSGHQHPREHSKGRAVRVPLFRPGPGTICFLLASGAQKGLEP